MRLHFLIQRSQRTRNWTESNRGIPRILVILLIFKERREVESGEKKSKKRKRGAEERRIPLSPYPPPPTPLLARFPLHRPNYLHACHRLPTDELILRF